MAHYRLYFMNPLSGHIDRAVDLDARDDSDAARQCVMRTAKRPLELWCAGRKVRRFEVEPAGDGQRVPKGKAQQRLPRGAGHFYTAA